MIDQEDEDIHVYLPRFELNTKLRLVDLLKKVSFWMEGIQFNLNTAQITK